MYSILYMYIFPASSIEMQIFGHNVAHQVYTFQKFIQVPLLNSSIKKSELVMSVHNFYEFIWMAATRRKSHSGC